MVARNASLLAVLILIQSAVLFGQSNEHTKRWIEQLRNPAPSYRAQAAVELARQGPAADTAVQDLLALLEDPDANVRLCAIDAVGKIGGTPVESAHRILDSLNDPDEHVRYAAEWALARLAHVPVDDHSAAKQAANFTAALKTVRHRQHHVQYRIIVERALGRLKTQIKQHQERLHAEAQARAQALADARQQDLDRKVTDFRRIVQEFELAGTIDQLKLIGKLANVADPDLADAAAQVRYEVLKQAILRREMTSVHFALQHWRDTGQDAICRIFEDFPAQSKLPNWATSVLEHVNAQHLPFARKLSAIAELPSNSVSIRTSAASALSRTCGDDALVVGCLLWLVQPEQQFGLRRAAINLLSDRIALQNQNATPDQRKRVLALQQTVADSLLALINTPEELWGLRVAAAAAASKVQSASTQACIALENAILAEDLREYQLPAVLTIFADAEYRSPAAEQLLIRALACDNDLTRNAAAEIVAGRERISDELIELLIERFDVLEESPQVLLTCVDALVQGGAHAIQKFANRILESEPNVQLQQLRALASAGRAATPAMEICAVLVQDDSREPAVRTAAALLIATMGPEAREVAPALHEFVDTATLPSMRSAGFLALAEIGELGLPEMIQSMPNQPGDTAQVITAVAMHSAGQSEGIVRLVNLLGRDTDELASKALLDIGLPAQTPLLDVASDVSADSDQRISAMRILVQIPDVDYRPLISLLDDSVIGQPCVSCLRNYALDPPPEFLGRLIEAMQDSTSEPSQMRLKQLIESMTSGLGAGGELDSIVHPDHLAEGLLSRVANQAPIRAADPIPLSTGTLAELTFPEVQPSSPTDDLLPSQMENVQADGAAGHSATGESYVSIDVGGPEHASGGGAFPDHERLTLSPNTSASSGFTLSLDPPHPNPTQTPQNTLRNETSGQASDTASEPVVPQPESAAIAPNSNPFAPLSSQDSRTPDSPAETLPQEPNHANPGSSRIKVFYGTNRAPIWDSEDQLGTVATTDQIPRKMLAILAGAATIALCIFGFLRQKSHGLMLIALCGTVTALWIGIHGPPDVKEEKPQAASRVELQYSGHYSDRLAMGVCEVSIPDTHVPGELESPSVFRFEFRPNEKKHIVLHRTTELDDGDFFSELKGELDDRGRSLLVFLHGYNVSFEDAARRTAQMSHDLKFAGAPVFYSWPSRGNWYKYQLDKKNIQLSVGHIKEFLLELAERSQAETIHLIAHSMGNVGLTGALSEIEQAGSEALFNQVVLAAPDIDADLFKSRIAPKIAGKSERCTVYTSSADLALVASRYFNSGRRAGESGEPVLSYPGFDVVDASAVDTSLLGHSYYGNASVLSDLSEVLVNRPIGDRTFLKTALSEGQPYWVFESPFLAGNPPTPAPIQPTLR